MRRSGRGLQVVQRRKNTSVLRYSLESVRQSLTSHAQIKFSTFLFEGSRVLGHFCHCRHEEHCLFLSLSLSFVKMDIVALLYRSPIISIGLSATLPASSSEMISTLIIEFSEWNRCEIVDLVGRSQTTVNIRIILRPFLSHPFYRRDCIHVTISNCCVHNFLNAYKSYIGADVLLHKSSRQTCKSLEEFCNVVFFFFENWSHLISLFSLSILFSKFRFFTRERVSSSKVS